MLDLHGEFFCNHVNMSCFGKEDLGYPKAIQHWDRTFISLVTRVSPKLVEV